MMSSNSTHPVLRSLTVLALTTAATAASGQQPPERQRSSETRNRVEARALRLRDSLRAEQGTVDELIERLARDLIENTQAQVRASQAISRLRAGELTVSGTNNVDDAIRRLQAQVESAARETQILRSRLIALCDRDAKPDGYMGITFSATMRTNAAPGGAEVFEFAENPTVETVEPGSPAERAGVEKGDEIILIGNQAVVGRPIMFTRLLRPGARLPIRIRRDGGMRDVVLTIRQRPPALDNGCPFLDARVMAAFGDPLTISPLRVNGAMVPRAAAGPRVATGSIAPRAVEPGATVITIAPPAPSTPPTPDAAGWTPIVPSVPLPAPNAPGGGVYVYSAGPNAPVVIAGATMIRTNADLRESFGVKTGVLVLDVARGTPAYTSGLKGGDVITAVGRAPVTSPFSLERAIQSADRREITLQIVRKKRAQALVLRW